MKCSYVVRSHYLISNHWFGFSKGDRLMQILSFIFDNGPKKTNLEYILVHVSSTQLLKQTNSTKLLKRPVIQHPLSNLLIDWTGRPEGM